ncbi:MAG: DUF3099 domain-containing protein [Corynebacterium sp.]|uniref:DUF3099 domain-containing protein n=1 Tax=Corynebacterium sp. TaxID=1720 RepID=UPI0026DD5E5D|nr:DUF3099 domain-containing protein [Corynebacterium sp.]MDO4760706.1 DUF3099 domain-containing protein [Corynebacterium sp.]
MDPDKKHGSRPFSADGFSHHTRNFAAQEHARTDNAGFFDASECDVVDVDEGDSSNEGDSGAGIKRRKLSLKRRKNVILVTTAGQSVSENRRKREKQYTWIQGVRLPFLVLAALAYMYFNSVLIASVLFIISVPLPWIAVVIANGVGEPRDSRAPAVYKPAAIRAQMASQIHASSQQSVGGGPLSLPSVRVDSVVDSDEVS